MRSAFAHEAVVEMAADGDERVLGGAITVALCGSWEHESPCPLAPHHTGATRSGDSVRVRTLFAVEPSREGEVRGLIEDALRAGRASDPDGQEWTWRLRSGGAAPVRPDELDHAARLTAS